MEDQERVRFLKLSPEAQVMMEVRLAYKKNVEELSFTKYGRLVKLMKESHLEYFGYTGAAYYTILEKSKHQGIMMDTFFKKAKIISLEEKTGEVVNNETVLC